MKYVSFILLSIFSFLPIFAQENISISGVIDWETMEIRSTVSMNLTSAKIKLPAGRNQAESLLLEGYYRLVRKAVLDLQVDSSSTIANLVEKGELTLAEIDVFSGIAQFVPPSLSRDMLDITGSYSIPITAIGSNLQNQKQPSAVSRILNPVSTPNYTGIIIIASEKLPVHGTRSSLLAVPCLFPKIWDTDMNLIYERKMVVPNTMIVQYSTPRNILFNTPSGLSLELQKIVGERPLRIFARGVFGINPTDLIIDRTDALEIISNENNRNLLTQGKVVIILDDSVLRYEYSF